MRLSIVTTLYYSAPYVAEFCRRVSEAAARLTDDFEIVLVNDGSPDKALAVAIEQVDVNPRVRVVDLSRNFGQHKAIMTGLAHARGDLVFLLDADLEEDPEILLDFYELLVSRGADVVYGVQSARKGGLVERITGGLFYVLFNALTSYPVPANVLTARLMTRRYVTALVAHRDQEIFLAGLWAVTGFEQIPVTVKKRYKGSTTYSFRKKWAIVVNSVTSFSNRPLILIFYLGCIILLLSGLAASFLVIRRIFFGVLLAGWPSLIVSVWMLGGLMIFCLGVIGMYLSKIFTETKSRPYTVVRHVYERAPGGGQEMVEATTSRGQPA